MSSRRSRDQFGDERRSEIVTNAQDLSMEDLIAPEDVVVTLSHSGYVKAQPLADYRAQKRGGRGKQATATKEDDFIDNLFIANTHDYMLCFSSRGRSCTGSRSTTCRRAGAPAAASRSSTCCR